MAIKRALTAKDVMNYKPHLLNFESEWLDLIGKPELTGTWLIWGNSANGKTRFALQLAKYMSKFARVAYNSLEEGLSQSMKAAISDVGMMDAKGFLLLDKEPINELAERLRKRKSPDVIIIDSLQYTGMNYCDYKKLKDEFRNKLFIFVSHADGREPKGQVGKSIRYDAFVKIIVSGYMAKAESRYGGDKDSQYVVWQKGYDSFYACEKVGNK